jgi:hypothetical protein
MKARNTFKTGLAGIQEQQQEQQQQRKYAASWGLIDAAATAAASPGPASLARPLQSQEGCHGTSPRRSAAGPAVSPELVCVPAPVPASYPGQQQQQGTTGTPAQQYSAGAAGCYAQHAASVTPVECPRSGAPLQGGDPLACWGLWSSEGLLQDGATVWVADMDSNPSIFDAALSHLAGAWLVAGSSGLAVFLVVTAALQRIVRLLQWV